MNKSPGYGHYVILVRNDIRPGSVEIVGPFGDEDAAAEYGAAWQADHDDNLNWQTVTLPVGYEPKVRKP